MNLFARSGVSEQANGGKIDRLKEIKKILSWCKLGAGEKEIKQYGRTAELVWPGLWQA